MLKKNLYKIFNFFFPPKKFFFICSNDITGRFVDVHNKRFDVKAINIDEIRFDPSRIHIKAYRRLKDFIKNETSLKEFY